MVEQETDKVTDSAPTDVPKKKRISLRRAFFTGLAALLPTALTIVILAWVFHLVSQYVAQPLNNLIISIIDVASEGNRPEAERLFYAQGGRGWIDFRWAGFVVALSIIFLVGFVLLTIFGRRLYRAVDRLLSKVPVLRMIYPHVKQLTDFVFSDDKVSTFRRVVMIEYPRRGVWSLGFVTGPSLAAARHGTGEDLMSVFVPSSPTPFTGYVVAVPRAEAIDIPISVDEALRFTISGGVLVPPSQRAETPPSPPPKALEDTGASVAATDD